MEDVDPMEPKHTAATRGREVALLLPGMTMNRTLFPALGRPTLDLDFTRAAPPPADPERGPTMDDYVAALDAYLARHADVWDRPLRLVVGHSFGGMLALRWLLRHGGRGPAEIAALVLVGVSAGPLFRAVRLRLGAGLGREWRIPLAPVLPLWNSRVLTRTMKRLTSGGLHGRPQDFRTLRRRSDLAIDLAGWRNTDWRAMRAFRFALDGYDVRAELPRVHVQTIVLHGTRDSLFPLDEARRLAAGLPNTELRVVAGAGHGLPLTHGDHVVQAVRDIVRRETGDGGRETRNEKREPSN
ncbi:MAG: alpha/beta hydrolase [Gemmatimonadales bacterium]|jgi:pimeloyl-ACP methyl ester carboxylesterase